MNSRESGHRIARQVTSWVGAASVAGAVVVGAAVSAPAAAGNTSSGNTSSGDTSSGNTGQSTTPNYGSRHHYSSTSPVQPLGPGSTAPQGRSSGS
ncbi:hypothetical protein BMF89_01365 [Arthrobacter sp. SRS-W-1-2016]|jgi:hypothetical protein|uniref:hypothetical protein n=1 Tax=Arthrobacter TaxID=1663 RepID=UPI000990EB67|nr:MULTISPECIES: hypothetical protein [Arthrobacter]MDQ0210413.1 hypothetical protein [Arthrobacter bambusae]MDQ0234862.1 hypothetical protein [Arthrobacter bambusae]OOP65067.1 hypothetical protein BMF89_01365 [Arthrobacter sp. SRS-W-1-2016]